MEDSSDLSLQILANSILYENTILFIGQGASINYNAPNK